MERPPGDLCGSVPPLGGLDALLSIWFDFGNPVFGGPSSCYWGSLPWWDSAVWWSAGRPSRAVHGVVAPWQYRYPPSWVSVRILDCRESFRGTTSPSRSYYLVTAQLIGMGVLIAVEQSADGVDRPSSGGPHLRFCWAWVWPLVRWPAGALPPGPASLGLEWGW